MKIACILNMKHSFPLALNKTESRPDVSGDRITQFLRNQQRNSGMKSIEDNLNNFDSYCGVGGHLKSRAKPIVLQCHFVTYSFSNNLKIL